MSAQKTRVHFKTEKCTNSSRLDSRLTTLTPLNPLKNKCVWRNQDATIPTMNELSVPQELSVLDKSIYLARFIGSAVEVLRPLVYEVYEKELWRDRFSSFGEYVESPDGLNRSQGYASKLRANEQFRLDNGLSEQDLQGIDYECLYLSIKSGGTPEEILAKARTLNRLELKQERAEKDQHPFEENPNCKKCGLNRESHGN